MQYETDGQRLFSLAGAGTVLGKGYAMQVLYVAVLEQQPYGARLLELRNGAPAFTEAARFACTEGVACAPLDARTARVDILSKYWAVAVGLVPTGNSSQLLVSWARVDGEWRQGAAVAVPPTEVVGLQATTPFDSPPLSILTTKDLGVWHSNVTAYTGPG